MFRLTVLLLNFLSTNDEEILNNGQKTEKIS